MGADSLVAQQAPGFKVTEIKVDFPETPRKGVNAQGSKKKALEDEKWMEIEAQFEANPDDRDVPGKFLDQVQVKIHVLAPEDEETGQREIYSVDLVYGPLRKSREVYAVAYLPPAVVGRFGGDSVMKTKANVAVEIFFKGRVQGEMELLEKGKKAGEEGWYTRGGKTGVLVPVTKTPWAMDYWDRYPPLMEAGR